MLNYKQIWHGIKPIRWLNKFNLTNETIPIRIETYMIFQSWLYKLLQQLPENRTLLALHSHQSPHLMHQSPHLMHQISSKAKMRLRFMILYQPSLNGLLFIFPPPLLYKPPFSFIPKDTKKPPLFSSLEF